MNRNVRVTMIQLPACDNGIQIRNCIHIMPYFSLVNDDVPLFHYIALSALSELCIFQLDPLNRDCG